jgi:hypothetical protein
MGPDQLTRTPAGRLPGYSLVFAVTGQRREASSALVSGRARGTGCCSAAGGLGRSRWRRRAPAGFQTGSSLPKSEHDRIRFSYWSGSALSDATSVKDGKLRLSELEHAGCQAAAARCLSDDLDALVVHLRYPLRHRERSRVNG